MHSHSTFSYGDGFGLPREHVARVAELGGNALALTEHGNVSSHAQLEQAANKAGIKPLFGCELYTAADRNRRKWHLTVIAENETGYQNLMRLVSRSYAEGFYFWPTVSGDMLAEHSEGLIVTSGCADSLLACDLLGGKGRELHEDRPDMDGALRTVRRFKRLFGDRYYLEVQAFPELARTRTLNAAYAALSDKSGVPLVATADVHYPYPDDNELQKVLHAALRAGTGTVEAAEASWEYNIRLTYPTSDAVLVERLTGTGLSQRCAEEALRNTELIADRATVTLPKAEMLRYPTPVGQTNQELIWEWLRAGWKFRRQFNKRLRHEEQAYVDRLKYEMEIITGKDFIDYFLMLSDVVRFAKDAGIPVGPARGSAAASLTCYLLRITEVDPLQFPQMVFERFIDTTRADLPDVDLDFADDRRDEIRQHLIRRWGRDNVGNIGNFTRYRGKNSVNDVARVYQIPKYEAETVNGLIVERSGGDSRFDASLEDTITMFPQAAAVFERHPELNAAVRLEGNYRGLGVHAAGIVVSSRPITDVTAVYQRTVGADKRVVDVLAVDKYDAAYLNLLKADFLGLKTMGMIDTALQDIGMTLNDLYNIPLDDKETLAAFRRADVVGIFQFEGRATRLLCRSVEPDNFMHLSDINALSRPGPLFSGAANAYVEIKHGRDKPEHLHPIVDKYVGPTYGQIIYQEQVLNIIREMGGFPVAKVSFIRRVISQKYGEQQFNTVLQDFIAGAAKHGVDEKLATKIWKLMVTSATYSFNVAHSISYSMIGFWSQWLKQHYPSQFYAAHLSKINADKDGRPKIARLIKDADRHGVDVRGPDLHQMTHTWSANPAKHVVRAGLTQIPGIGVKMAEPIMAAGPYETWKDLLRVKGIGPKKIELIRGFAEEDDPFGVLRPGQILNRIRKELYPGNELGLLVPTHRSDDIDPNADKLRLVWMGFVLQRNYQDYIENQRSRTGEEIEEIIARMKQKDKVTSCVLRCADDGDEDVYLRFNRFDFPRFAAALEGLTIGDVVIARGVKHHAGFGISVAVKQLQVLDTADWEADE